jgi:hypothetical protein
LIHVLLFPTQETLAWSALHPGSQLYNRCLENHDDDSLSRLQTL